MKTEYKIIVGWMLAVAAWFLLVFTSSAYASCGCDKPPPEPAEVLPHFAYTGMKFRLFNKALNEGDQWTVQYEVGYFSQSFPVSVTVVRDITDPTGETFTPALQVVAPNTLGHYGPTNLVATKGKKSFQVEPGLFTTIGNPIVLTDQNRSWTYRGYKTGISQSHTVFVAFQGLEQVCGGMTYTGYFTNYPLQLLDSKGSVTLWNPQGYLIDALTGDTSAYFYRRFEGRGMSDGVVYKRHSFEQYCSDHMPGGTRETSEDPDWHVVGTPHVDYGVMVVELKGLLPDGSEPVPGPVSLDVHVTSRRD